MGFTVRPMLSTPRRCIGDRKRTRQRPGPPGRGSADGFALVIALSLMALAVLLMLALATLTQVETQSAATQMRRLEAESNALLALNIALGQLQRFAGSDQRITARSDLTSADAANPHWTGVWDASADELDANTPLIWLNSANSVDDPLAVGPDTEGLHDDPNAVPLLPANPDSDDLGVRLPPQDLPDGGSYAWWVADEGIKAKINENDPLADADPRESDRPKENRARFKTMRRVGVPFLHPDEPGLLGSLDWGDPTDRESLSRLVSLPQIPLLQSSVAADAPRRLFDSTTLFSRGVLADTRDGGLRKDLTRGLDFQNFPESPLKGQPIFSAVIESGPLAGEAAEGPYWDVLADYFQHFRRVDDSDPLNPVAPIVTPRDLSGDATLPGSRSYSGIDAAGEGIGSSALHPVLMRSGLKCVLRLEPIGSPSEIPNPYEPDGDPLSVRDYRPAVHFHPFVTLWNPYDITLESQSYRVTMDFFQFPEDDEFTFEVHAGRNARLASGKHKPILSYIDPILEDGTPDPLYTEVRETITGFEVEFETEPVSFAPGEILMFFLPLGSGQSFNPENPPANPITLSTDPTQTSNDFEDPLTPSLRYGMPTLTELSADEHHVRFLWRFSYNHGSGPSAFNDRFGDISNRKTPGEPYPLWNQHSNTARLELASAEGDPLQAVPTLDGSGFQAGIFMERNHGIDGSNPGSKTLRDGYNGFMPDDFADLVGSTARGTRPVGPDFVPRGIQLQQLAGRAMPFFSHFNHRAGFSDAQRYLSETFRPLDPGPNGRSFFTNSEINTYGHWSSPLPRHPSSVGIAQDATTLPDRILGYGLFGILEHINFFPNELVAPSVLPAFHVPSLPPYSIAELRHANLGFQATTPAYALGESLLPARLPEMPSDMGSPLWQAERTAISGLPDGDEPMPFVDLSYWLNRTLWDDYFFSTVPAENGESAYPGMPTDFDAAYLAAGGALPNPRITHVTGADGSPPSPEQLRDYEEAARHLLLDGAFNVNSTSVEAWRALIASMSQQGLRYRDEVIDRETLELDLTEADGDEPIAFFGRTPRFVGPQIADVTSASDTLLSRRLSGGLRTLDHEQLTVLAEEIVAIIREEGPFQSLADFINRDPAADYDPVDGRDSPVVRGPLSRAIRRADARLAAGADGLPINRADQSQEHTAFGRSPLDNGSYVLPHEGILDYTGEGMPGWLTQGDLLSVIGTVLSARSDTFVIRAYGANSPGLGGGEEFGVWCEAVVQRFPEPTAADDDWENPASPFGRQFQVAAFRWLTEEQL